ncbi:hypothetical protein [Arthrobacter sp. NicSoilB8]|uniref:hypothetical protein n=1 Tax=Arthrobacter sp. NicSoilB8 TaxID=2830998 RepID=UPI0021E11DC1|nr:hypothetical protein [Arthrobacter sp. NicSoilB8]
MLLTFVRGLAAFLNDGAAAKSGRVLAQGTGVSLIASRPFVADPSAIFAQATPHGIFGAIVFTSAPLSSFSTGASAAIRTGAHWQGGHYSVVSAQDQPAGRERSVLMERSRATGHSGHVHGLPGKGMRHHRNSCPRAGVGE